MCVHARRGGQRCICPQVCIHRCTQAGRCLRMNGKSSPADLLLRWKRLSAATLRPIRQAIPWRTRRFRIRETAASQSAAILQCIWFLVKKLIQSEKQWIYKSLGIWRKGCMKMIFLMWIEFENFVPSGLPVGWIFLSDIKRNQRLYKQGMPLENPHSSIVFLSFSPTWTWQILRLRVSWHASSSSVREVGLLEGY